jgi:urease accessory protein
MRAISVKRASTWTGDPADSIVLAFDDRHRRRMSMTGTHGLEFLLDLPQATSLRSGDAMVLEDGRLIEVVAAPEPLMEIRCADALHLARIAWHLGNRHLPAQLLGQCVRIRRDHVIAEMAVGLGARVIGIEAPFDPETGAYGEVDRNHDHPIHDRGHEHAHHLVGDERHSDAGGHDHGH